jgi:hypothetical protein
MTELDEITAASQRLVRVVYSDWMREAYPEDYKEAVDSQIEYMKEMIARIDKDKKWFSHCYIAPSKENT